MFFVAILISTFSASMSDTIEVNEVKLFSRALSAIVRDYYVKNNLGFDFLIANQACNDFAREIISNVVRENSHLIGPVLVSTSDESNIDQIHLLRSTIIFVDEDLSCENLLERIRMKNSGYIRFQHYIVTQKNILSDSRVNLGIKNASDHNIVHYINFVFCNSGKYLHILALFTFNDRKCGMGFQYINTFSRSQDKWSNNIFHDQYSVRQYNHCNVSVAYEFWPGEKINVFVEFIFKVFGEQFDFIPTFHYYTSVKELQKMPRHPLFMFYIKDLSNFLKSLEEYHFFILTNSEIALLVSTGESYGMFEKLALPFDLSTWISIVLCFLMSFFVIFLLKQMNNEVQSFVFGLHVSTPSLNVIAAFFGQGQTILPGRNFARYMLMLLILFCLIIRTGYQSLQFDLMLTVSNSI